MNPSKVEREKQIEGRLLSQWKAGKLLGPQDRSRELSDSA